MDRFAYFTLRLRLQDPPAPASGVVEDLATGEKREFTGADQLIELLGAGAPGPRKMQPRTGVGQMGMEPAPGERP
ncbi:MAG TPA: hypothetical protein VF037_10905 [Gemmatimonadales bacterium]